MKKVSICRKCGLKIDAEAGTNKGKDSTENVDYDLKAALSELKIVYSIDDDEEVVSIFICVDCEIEINEGIDDEAIAEIEEDDEEEIDDEGNDDNGFPISVPSSKGGNYNGQIDIWIDLEDVKEISPGNNMPTGYCPKGCANNAAAKQPDLMIGSYIWTGAGYRLQESFHPKPFP